MAKLTDTRRAQMPKSAFAYIDSRGNRRLPIYDQAHVRSALSRFNQVQFESDAAREQARSKLLLAAKRHGVVPVGFIEAQLRTERTRGQADTQAKRVAGLPSGTVTFLMTDIEGSTALLADMGVKYGALLAEIRRVQREKVRRAGGHDVEAHADEFLAVFSNAAGALDAAIGIQHRFAEKEWHAPRPIRVRIGVHRGHPNLTETGYIGLSVHAVSRVCQAAHGGQIVMSRTAKDGLTDGLPDGRQPPLAGPAPPPRLPAARHAVPGRG